VVLFDGLWTFLVHSFTSHFFRGGESTTPEYLLGGEYRGGTHLHQERSREEGWKMRGLESDESEYVLDGKFSLIFS
jgi:hypothetical protein